MLTDCSQCSCQTRPWHMTSILQDMHCERADPAQSLVFDTPQVFDFLKVDSDAALLPPVDLTGNVNMIEKLVLGGTGIGDLPILSPTRWPLRHQDRGILAIQCVSRTGTAYLVDWGLKAFAVAGPSCWNGLSVEFMGPVSWCWYFCKTLKDVLVHSCCVFFSDGAHTFEFV